MFLQCGPVLHLWEIIQSKYLIKLRPRVVLHCNECFPMPNQQTTRLPNIESVQIKRSLFLRWFDKRVWHMSLYCVFIAGTLNTGNPAVTLPAARMSSSGLIFLITFSKMICFKIPHINWYQCANNINTGLTHRRTHLSFRLNIKPSSALGPVSPLSTTPHEMSEFCGKIGHWVE